MVEDYQIRQLLPGKHLDELANKFIRCLNRTVCWQHLSTAPPYVQESSPTSVRISSMDWTSNVFIDTTTELYWGKSLSKANPRLLKSFLRWEKTNWKNVFQLPRFLSEDMYAAKDQLVNAFAAYFSLPNGERTDANYFVKAAEEELRDIGFNDQDLGKVHMLQHWA